METAKLIASNYPRKYGSAPQMVRVIFGLAIFFASISAYRCTVDTIRGASRDVLHRDYSAIALELRSGSGLVSWRHED